MQIMSPITFDFGSEQHASWFFEALEPEIISSPMKRASWEISVIEGKKKRIQVNITADDPVAFRATVNSLCRLAYIADLIIRLT